MASPPASTSQRLTFVGARQEWKNNCVILGARYRNGLDLDARHRQEIQDLVRSMAFIEPPVTDQHPRITIMNESQAEHLPEDAMDTQQHGIGLPKADTETKTANKGPHRWELHFTTVRPVPHSPTDLPNQNRADGNNRPPKRQRLEQSTAHNENADRIKTMTYADVRQNAIDGYWDTIIEWPEQSKQFWVCFCEEHGIHFKQKADNAAAKHLAGSLHGLPTRERRTAIVQLGYYIPDCTEELRNSHNAEVNEKFAAGYTPRPVRNKDNLPLDKSPRKANPPAPEGKRVITHPKTAHVYYAKYQGQYWAVVILGWDKLPEGCRHTTLGASELIKHDPPKCYTFDGCQKITGWKPKWVDGAKLVEKREFPVMYFDEDLNYGWVPARDLSKLELDRVNAPKRKGYPEESYNAARDWVAQRAGHKNWESLNAARKGQHATEPGGMDSIDMPSLIRNTDPVQILSFNESLKRLPLADENKVSEKGQSARSTPAVAPDSAIPVQRQTNHSSAPPAPALTPPVIIPPPLSAPSQMPTPQTPTQGQLQLAAIHNSQAYEISAFEYQAHDDGGQVQSQLIWQRASRNEPCVRLVISSDGRTAQAEGGLFHLTINPPECRQIRLKTPLDDDGLVNEHGISYVTVHMVSGLSVRLTFDRSDDQSGKMGCVRARVFARWLWGQNPKMKS